MAIAPGTHLGGYEILALLGIGGMGEVYKARDRRLGREVALKLLPPDVAHDGERRMRFEQEARAVAALNHPHIVTLYSLEEVDGAVFLTLELVDGETLGAAMARERMATPAVLRIASAMADAVGCAHERGILHRDLKPANVMLTRDGRVKVLDFGLAKLKEAPADPREPATVTRLGPLTDRRVVLGTPDYMSPEQAENAHLDERSDIFSLGVILYEMATGERPFRGGSVMSVISSVLRDTPRPITEVNPLAPASLANVVRRCLAKDPALRYQAARALAADLESLRRQLDGESGSFSSFEGKKAGATGGEVRSTPVAWSPVTPPTPTRRSVAVLPFLNLSADPENEFFADGITEDVIAQLSKMRSLKVISRTSAMQFKKREMSLGEIAAKLGVATLVEGSVRKAGNRVRIVAELVEAATDEHLWAETFDRQLTDIFEIQSEVALNIAEALKAELTPSERARIEGPAAVDLEAYQLLLKGRQCFNRFTRDEIARALDFYQRAVAIEPRYALAYDGIAWVYILQGGGHGAGAMRPVDAYGLAREAIRKALEFDPLCGVAYGTLAAIQMWADYDWQGAEQSFRRSIELAPGAAFTHDVYALMLSAQERFDEAIAAQRRSRELDPLAPIISSDLATTYLRAGRLEEAARQARRLIELDATFPYGHSTLGWALLFQGEAESGIEELRKAVSLSPGNTLFFSQLGEALGLTGQRGQALGVLGDLQRMAGERYVAPYHFAYIYAGLGEDDKALDVLEQAVEERAGGVYGIKGSFLFTTLRDHPRFKALLRRMNLDDRYRSGGVRFPKPS